MMNVLITTLLHTSLKTLLEQMMLSLEEILKFVLEVSMAVCVTLVGMIRRPKLSVTISWVVAMVNMYLKLLTNSLNINIVTCSGQLCPRIS